jgi:hypothetical protein
LSVVADFTISQLPEALKIPPLQLNSINETSALEIGWPIKGSKTVTVIPLGFFLQVDRVNRRNTKSPKERSLWLCIGNMSLNIRSIFSGFVGWLPLTDSSLAPFANPNLRI